jgi:predicted Zn-dependent protease with MMP-like domain
VVDDFEAHVERALASLPADLAARVENLAILVEDENEDDPDLFGLFEELEYLPATIHVYRRPLADAFPDPADLEREIRITVLHEVAHYFGIDEARLEELGYD